MHLLTGMIATVLVALLVTTGWVLGHPQGSPLEDRLGRAREELLRSVPNPGTQARVRRQAASLADTLCPLLLPRVGVRRLDPRGPAEVMAIRACLSLAVLPLAGTLAVLSATWGLLARRRLMDRHGFHSLTFSYLGKLLVVGSSGIYAFTSLAPLAPPLWTLYLWAALGSGGLALYFRNLPPRL
jgi:hypothetical protein